MVNFWIDSKSIDDDLIEIQSRSMSDPSLSDNDFKSQMALVLTTIRIYVGPRFLIFTILVRF